MGGRKAVRKHGKHRKDAREGPQMDVAQERVQTRSPMEAISGQSRPHRHPLPIALNGKARIAREGVLRGPHGVCTPAVRPSATGRKSDRFSKWTCFLIG